MVEFGVAAGSEYPGKIRCKPVRLARDERIGIFPQNLCCKPADGPADEGMDPLGHEFGGRDQGEGPLVEPGVGQIEFRSAPDEIAGHEEIEIEDPGAPSLLG